MSKCIQCGNIYSSEPETKMGLCFRCEIKQKDQQIAELKQQLHTQPKEIVEKIKHKLCDRLNKIAGYGRITNDELSFFVETEFAKDLEEILKEYEEK